MPKSTPKIVAHVLESRSETRRILHNGISYSVRAYQLLVVDHDKPVIAKTG